MQRLKSFKNLIALMVMLMLANSSLALEIVTHDGHGHEQTESMIDMPVIDMHSAHEAVLSSDHVNSDKTSFGHVDDDCICDEICCVSSVDFGSGLKAGSFPDNAFAYQRPSNHYASVSLDLVLQPPTH